MAARIHLLVNEIYKGRKPEEELKTKLSVIDKALMKKIRIMSKEGLLLQASTGGKTMKEAEIREAICEDMGIKPGELRRSSMSEAK